MGVFVRTIVELSDRVWARLPTAGGLEREAAMELVNRGGWSLRRLLGWLAAVGQRAELDQDVLAARSDAL